MTRLFTLRFQNQMKGRDPFYSFDTLPQIQVAHLFVEIAHCKLSLLGYHK